MKVLICPLNWGLGHATRCIPIIQNYLVKGHEIYIASDGLPQQILKEQFPKLCHFDLPSYNIQYSPSDSQIMAMFASIPKIISGIFREHLWIKRFVKTHNIELIISDNRFGCWHKTIPSYYITHQLMIKMPKLLVWTEPIVWLGHRIFINQYTKCWIPDIDSEKNLSGDLSHKYPLPKNAEFIGISSRFSEFKNIEPNNGYSILALISGPEPQRSIFEKTIYDRLFELNKKSLLIRGLPGEKKLPDFYNPGGNVRVLNHLNSEALASIIKGCSQIICRSGYTTIMDLHTLGCLDKAEFHPTPGQTEQEYLKEHLKFIII